MENEGAIELRRVSKKFRVAERNGKWTELFVRRYREVIAIKDISIKIEPGEIVGYIGPNGAGKSTSIKIMCGILAPDSGEALLNGKRAASNRKKNSKEIGVVFGQRTQLWWDLPVKDSFVLLKDMYGISNEDYYERLAIFDEILDLKTFVNTPVRSLSLGQKMRAEIAAAFLHNPSIVLLDEPTIGLDIVSKRNILKFITQINYKYNTTILLTTHDLAEIEAVCQRIVIIDKGKVLFDDDIKYFYKKYGSVGKISFTVLTEKNLQELQRQFTNVNLMQEGQNCIIKYEREQVNENELLAWLYINCDIQEVAVIRETLEDMVHNLYTKGFKEKES